MNDNIASRVSNSAKSSENSERAQERSSSLAANWTCSMMRDLGTGLRWRWKIWVSGWWNVCERCGDVKWGLNS